MRRIAVVVLSILPLGGCGYATAIKGDNVLSRHDLSTGASTAVIDSAGKHSFGSACSIVQNEDHYREVVIDAGPVALQVDCSRVTGVFGEQTEQLGRANIAFRADAGHRYRIEVSKDFGFAHVAVKQAQPDGQVIHRSLLGSSASANAAAAHATLIARSGSGVISCRFGRPWTDSTVSAVRRPAGSFVNEPYSHQIVAQCSTYAYVTGDVKERYEAPIDFVPVSGRLYTVHMDEQNREFLFVTDVSSDVRTIAHLKATRTH